MPPAGPGHVAAPMAMVFPECVEEITDFILRSAVRRVSKSPPPRRRGMATSPCRASILRDGRKSALLRMKAELIRTLFGGTREVCHEDLRPLAPSVLRCGRRRAQLRPCGVCGCPGQTQAQPAGTGDVARP